MTPAEAKTRIADLRAQVTRHDELYYRHAKPEISDFEYDRLKRELAEREAQFPEVAAGTRARSGATALMQSRPQVANSLTSIRAARREPSLQKIEHMLSHREGLQPDAHSLGWDPWQLASEAR